MLQTSPSLSRSQDRPSRHSPRVEECRNRRKFAGLHVRRAVCCVHRRGVALSSHKTGLSRPSPSALKLDRGKTATKSYIYRFHNVVQFGDTMFRRRQVLAAASSLTLMAAAPAKAARPATLEDSLWSGLRLQDQHGRSFQLGEGPAPITLVAMWAHWCPPCLAELPSLVTLAGLTASKMEVLLLSHPEYWVRDVAVAQQRRIPLRMATPSTDNSSAVIGTALLNGQGGYEVPRALAFRNNDQSIAWSQRGWTDWGSPAALAHIKAPFACGRAQRSR